MLEHAHVTIFTTRQARIRNVIALQDSWDVLLFFEPCMRKTANCPKRRQMSRAAHFLTPNPLLLWVPGFPAPSLKNFRSSTPAIAVTPKYSKQFIANFLSLGSMCSIKIKGFAMNLASSVIVSYHQQESYVNLLLTESIFDETWKSP